jgi:hypothetical protein
METAAEESQRRLGITAWMYIALSIVILGVVAASEALRPTKPATIPFIGWLGLVTSAAPPVTAAAFHFNHPTAWKSVRLIAGAFVALSIAATLGAVSAIEFTVGDLTKVEARMRDAYVLNGLAAFPEYIGGLVLWFGLRRARRRPGRRWSWAITVAVWIVVGIALAHEATLLKFWIDMTGGYGGVWGLMTIGFGVPPPIIAGLLATVLLRGAWAGERPTAGWSLAGIGPALVLVAGIVYPALLFIRGPTGMSYTVDIVIGSVAAAAAGLCIIAAFIVGLPATTAGPSGAVRPVELAPVG